MTRQRPSGFTLIELLVVVSIIALLISILLPFLQRAKDQAKLAACQSNVSQIGRVLMSYLVDLDELPLFASEFAACNWSFGGWSGRNREEWENVNPFFNRQTNQRPLSVYAIKGGDIANEIDRFTPTEEVRYYRCPADSVSAQWQWGTDPDELSHALAAYDDVGTSYLMNWSWFVQTHPDVVGTGSLSLSYRAGVLGAGLWKRMYKEQASRFLALYEDPVDYGMNNIGGICQTPPDEGSPGIQTMGFHGRFSNHVALYLDAHAEYRYIDTRHTHDSLAVPPASNRHGAFAVMGNWTAVDETVEHIAGGRHKPA